MTTLPCSIHPSEARNVCRLSRNVVSPSFLYLMYGTRQNLTPGQSLFFGGQPDIVRFGSVAPQSIPYNSLYIVTDFQSGTSNEQVYQRFHNVLQVVNDAAHGGRKLKGFEKGIEPGLVSPLQQLAYRLLDFFSKFLPFIKPLLIKNIQNSRSIYDVPPGNITSAAHSLYCLGATEKPDPRIRKLTIHVTDPGVGDQDSNASKEVKHARSILLTQNYGTYVGPNNGSLGLLIAFLQTRGEPFELLEIDMDKARQLEQEYLETLPIQEVPTFHGRDIFAVVAAAIAGGLSPYALAKPGRIQPIIPDFVVGMGGLPAIGESKSIRFFRDNTFGNLKTNIAISKTTLDKLIAEERNTGKPAVFEITYPKTGKSVQVSPHYSFKDVPEGTPFLYVGSTPGLPEKTNLVELAVNKGDFSKQLGIQPTDDNEPLEVKRIA